MKQQKILIDGFSYEFVITVTALLEVNRTEAFLPP